MKLKYTKSQLDFGEYRAGRVIWIRTLKGESLVKLNVLDKDGVLLYRVTELPGDTSYEIEEGYLTLEHLETIKDLISQNYPDFDREDEDEVDFMLGDFGRKIACCQWLAQDSKKSQQMIVDSVLYSTNDYIEDETFQTNYFEKGLTHDEVLKKYMAPKLIENSTFNALEVTISESGIVSNYQVTIEEVQDYD
ncbi:MAG: hypothetical protein ACLRPU_06575 [Enterococcus hulanensis]